MIINILFIVYNFICNISFLLGKSHLNRKAKINHLEAPPASASGCPCNSDSRLKPVSGRRHRISELNVWTNGSLEKPCLWRRRRRHVFDLTFARRAWRTPMKQKKMGGFWIALLINLQGWSRQRVAAPNALSRIGVWYIFSGGFHWSNALCRPAAAGACDVRGWHDANENRRIYGLAEAWINGKKTSSRGIPESGPLELLLCSAEKRNRPWIIFVFVLEILQNSHFAHF